uniref:Uncharacterized protein n=1 Tax=Glossina austeni TaxID=7395 RepID=A0A1A9V021_GLOAU
MKNNVAPPEKLEKLIVPYLTINYGLNKDNNHNNYNNNYGSLNILKRPVKSADIYVDATVDLMRHIELSITTVIAFSRL